MEFLCVCCSKKIKVTHGRHIKTCRNCGEVVCSSCRVKNGCLECVSQPDKLVYDYFSDKYKEKVRC